MQFTTSSLALLTACMGPLTAALPTAVRLQARDSICGVAPSNTTATAATDSAATLLGVPQITTNIAAGCLDFCKDTAGCVSVEYGAVVAGGETKCLMFTVAASALAVPGEGESLLAFDVDCAEVYKRV